MGESDILADLVVGAVPPSIRTTMSAEQISAVRDAVSRSVAIRRHKIDLRFSIPFIFSRYYVVLLVGKDTRTNSLVVAEEKRASTRTFFIKSGVVVWAVVAFFVGATIMYLVKSRLGINLFPWHLSDL